MCVPSFSLGRELEMDGKTAAEDIRKETEEEEERMMIKRESQDETRVSCATHASCHTL